MEFLRDSIWQFWGVAIGLLAIFVAIVIPILQIRKKRLAYYILTETPLLSVDEEIKGKIKIKYDRKNIQNMYLVVLRIENIGNVDIASSDYEQPLTFSFPNSEIVSAEVIDVSPSSLKPAISQELSKIKINPILLNRKDYFVCKSLMSKYEGQINVDARIIGIKEVERVYVDNSKSLSRIYERIILLIVAFILLFLAISKANTGVGLNWASWFGIIGLSGIIYSTIRRVLVWLIEIAEIKKGRH
jgi:hypothetical protein